MIKHTQTFRQEQLINCFNVFDHFLELAPKGLRLTRESLPLLNVQS